MKSGSIPNEHLLERFKREDATVASSRFILGAGLLYVGFLLFVIGFMTNAMSVPAFDEIGRTLIPLEMTQTLRGSIIQLAGGFLAVNGLLVCLYSLIKPPAPSVIIQKVPNPQPLRPTMSNSPTSSTLTSTMKCKYCGLPLRNGETFCPSCHRSQT